MVWGRRRAGARRVQVEAQVVEAVEPLNRRLDALAAAVASLRADVAVLAAVQTAPVAPPPAGTGVAEPETLRRRIDRVEAEVRRLDVNVACRIDGLRDEVRDGRVPDRDRLVVLPDPPAPESLRITS